MIAFAEMPPTFHALNDGREIAHEEAGEIVLTFGQHRGKPLSQVPDDYLVWMQQAGSWMIPDSLGDLADRERLSRPGAERRYMEALGLTYDDNPQRALTWADLISAEPRLALLLDVAKTTARTGRELDRYCATLQWIETIRPRLNSMVGHYAQDAPEELQTSRAWDVAKDTLLAALGNCSEDCICYIDFASA
jgi:uncharacterized protein (DUF3820 family)